MTAMTTILWLTAVVILSCVLFQRLSGKVGVPALLFFILLGMFFGTDGVVKIPFDNFELAQNVCSVALLFIMFYGGFGTNVRSARPVAAQAVLLSSVGTVLTAGLVGVFCHFVLGGCPVGELPDRCGHQLHRRGVRVFRTAQSALEFEISYRIAVRGGERQ